MSVDVEEWFHIPVGIENALQFDQWDSAEQRVQRVIPRLLEIFQKNYTYATFFFLGWVAEKHPNLVKDVLNQGHEVATHGYKHKLIYSQTSEEFKEDIYRAKSIIENISGKQVIGYRAPGFSIIPETQWAFEILSESGIRYDSSIFPAKRYYGHFEEFDLEPVKVITRVGEIIEFPQTVVNFGLFRLSCFGGGYFRIFPKFIFSVMSGIIERTGRPLIMYIHPRDIDEDQPKIKFPFIENIRHYINISKTEKKLDEISGLISFNSFNNIISDIGFSKNLKSISIT